MLQSIRDRAQGWIAWAIVILITIPFALWGIQEYLGVTEQPAVAAVDDNKITQTQYQRYLQNQRQRMQQILGNNYDPKLFDQPSIRRSILEEMIDDALLTKFISDHNMRSGDLEVAQLILSFPQFQLDGKYSEEAFQNFLRVQGITQEYFFYQLSSDILKQQVQSSIAGTGFTTPVLENEKSRLINQKRDISYMVISHKNFEKKVKISDEDINTYYQTNSQQFMTDEKVALEYIELSLQSLAKEIPLTDKQVRDYFNENKAQYVAEEQRRASHILFEVSQDNAEEVKSKAQKVLMDIKAGADFAAAAKKHSQDPGSASNGGDLGFFTRGVMTGAFEDAVYAMQKGDTSELVKTEFGYHIIKLTDIKRDEVDFNQVKKQVREDFSQREAESQYYDLAEQLSNVAYEQPDSLLPAAEATGLKIKATDLYSRNTAKGLMANPLVLQQAFSKELIKEAYNSEPVELGKEHIVILRVKEHQPASIKPLQAVRSDISKQLITRAAQQKSISTAEKILTDIEAGNSPVKLAQENNSKWLDKGLISRNDAAKVPVSVLQKAFTMPKKMSTGYAVTTTQNGDAVVLALNKVEDGETATVPDAVKQRAGQLNGRMEYAGLIEFIKNNSDITRNIELLK